MKKNVLISLIPDIIGLCGAASVVYGCHLIYAPAAYIFAGAIAITVAALGAKRWAS